tara:strand:- start:488 stop:949 length:462 start_codon:yes stop_codon:yes gene_type:complete
MALTKEQFMGYGQIASGLGTVISGATNASNLNLSADQTRLLGDINAAEQLRVAARDAARAERSKKIGIGAVTAQLAANGIVLGKGSAVDVIEAERLGYDKVIADINEDGKRAAFITRFTANAKADALEAAADNAILESVLGGAVSIGFGMAML